LKKKAAILILLIICYKLIFSIEIEFHENDTIKHLKIENRLLNIDNAWTFYNTWKLKRKVKVRDNKSYEYNDYDSLGRIQTKVTKTDSLGFETRIQYHSNGNILSKAALIENMKNGLVEIYNKEGKITEKRKFKEDKILWSKSVNDRVNNYYPYITHNLSKLERKINDTLEISLEYHDLDISEYKTIVFKYDFTRDTTKLHEPSLEVEIKKLITKQKFVDDSEKWKNTFIYGYSEFDGKIRGGIIVNKLEFH